MKEQTKKDRFAILATVHCALNEKFILKRMGEISKKALIASGVPKKTVKKLSDQEAGAIYNELLRRFLTGRY